MTNKEKYIKLFIKFLKKEKLMNNKEIYEYFIKYINCSFSNGFLPYCWLNSLIGKKYNIEDKYLSFIEEVFIEDIIKLFHSNLYWQEIDENEIRNDIKFQMRHNSVMSYCKEMLHKSFRTVLTDFYNL
jgi:hypothetical protein